MDAAELTPQEAARGALRAGLPLADDRHEVVASTAQHIHSVIATLRELDFGETPPAMSYSPELEDVRTAELEDADAAV
ncbi:hypothetical protein GCM10009837_10020 [Streptomyces durmitorensis]|uniref:Amidase n=1 Tax=Streptomyces durmitorensis TaxID=319947 RepID=A0ABY4PLF2_9ACTN|nr:hypothetical protein [Streptomyces durmitorensis]UQT54139.1 hypothetical protein M4V62_03040 [Streptomyces durmitorensis]